MHLLPKRLRAALPHRTKQSLVTAASFGAENLMNRRFRAALPFYIRQTLLTIAVFGTILFFLDAMTNAAIVAAFGSTAFIVFAAPRSHAARTRSVVGGQLVGMGTGIACDYLLRLDPLVRWAAHSQIPIALVAALAVGLSILVMIATDTKHAPAAGTALGFAVHTWGYSAIIFILVGAPVLSLARYLLLRQGWIRNL